MQSSATTKVLVVGDKGVGKTAMIKWYIPIKDKQKNWEEQQDSRLSKTAEVGVDFVSAEIKDNYILQVWDTEGPIKRAFYHLGNIFFRALNGCILMFDVTNHQSFENMKMWHAEVVRRTKEASEDGVGSAYPLVYVVLGNKHDLKDQRFAPKGPRWLEEARTWCRELDILYFPICAVTGFQVQMAMESTIKSIQNRTIRSLPRPIYCDNTENENLSNSVSPPIEISPAQRAPKSSRERSELRPTFSFSSKPDTTNWIADKDVNRCQDPNCRQWFTLFLRRHHCRQCGGVFCARCSEGKKLLPLMGYTTPVRVCDQCFSSLHG